MCGDSCVGGRDAIKEGNSRARLGTFGRNRQGLAGRSPRANFFRGVRKVRPRPARLRYANHLLHEADHGDGERIQGVPGQGKRPGTRNRGRGWRGAQQARDGGVDDFIMPVVAAATPDPTLWQTAVVPGRIPFKIGDFGSAVLNFLIVGFVAWRISKAFIRPAPAAAAPATKNCPFCKMSIDAGATRCAHCTSQL